MSTVLGVIRNHTPSVVGRVLKSGVFRLEADPGARKTTDLLVTVDTGFTGGFSLPKGILKRLDLDFLGYERYVLADQSKIHVPTFSGEVRVGPLVIETRFIPGQPLMGVEFMESAFSFLRLGFSAGRLTLK